MNGNKHNVMYVVKLLVRKIDFVQDENRQEGLPAAVSVRM
jgi:hypothetical protein